MSEFLYGLLPFLPTLVAVGTVLLGYSAWKRQLVGTRRISLLEDVLTNFYHARDAIAEIRSPFILRGEGSSITEPENSTAETQLKIRDYNVFIERFSQFKELFIRLQVQKYQFMATFRKEKPEPFSRLFKVINDLLNSNSQVNHPDSGLRFSSHPIDLETKQQLVEYKRVLYASPKDPIKQEVDDIIAIIEKIVDTELKRVS